MKKEKLEQALNQLDDSYIEEAAGVGSEHPAGRRRGVRWPVIAGYAAAAAILIVGLIFFFGRSGTERPLNEEDPGNASVQNTDPSQDPAGTFAGKTTEEDTEGGSKGQRGLEPSQSEQGSQEETVTSEAEQEQSTESKQGQSTEAAPGTEQDPGQWKQRIREQGSQEQDGPTLSGPDRTQSTEAKQDRPPVTEPKLTQPTEAQPEQPTEAQPEQPTEPQTEQPTEAPTEDRPEQPVIDRKYGEGITNLSKSVKKQKIAGKELPAAHGKALAKSGFSLLQKAMELEKDGDQNYLISPVSIQMALGMTATGADKGSKTEKELLSVIMPGAGSVSTLNKEMSAFSERMRNSKCVSWNVANSVWMNNCGDVELRDSYISDTANYYGAELYAAPFNDDTVKEINSWVSKNTKKRIKSILDELDEEARIVLANAVAFDGTWAAEYSKDQIHKDREFTNADGSTSKVVMLSSMEERVIKLEGGMGFVRPYNGGEYSFVGLLPPEGMTTEKYMKKILSSKKSFVDAYQKPVDAKAIVELPEFKTEYETNMDSVLQGLGVKEAYVNGQFRKMVTDGSVSVTIGSVKHKAMIKVNRKGTEAAAATAVIVNRVTSALDKKPVYQITLDRPFVYAIVDNATGVPVFLGVQNNMSE